MILSLETVGHETFSPLVGRVFTASCEQVSAELELKSVELLGHRRSDASRAPFSLVFQGAQGLLLAQGIYRFSCADLGDLELFITQIAGGLKPAEFEAVFT